MRDLRIGDTYYLKVNVLQSDGNPRDLSDITEVIYRMARSVRSTDYFVDKDLASLDVSIENTLSGIIAVKLSQADTKALEAGTAYHEIQIEAANGDIMTIMQEDIKLLGQLIRGS
jgi:transposase